MSQPPPPEVPTAHPNPIPNILTILRLGCGIVMFLLLDGVAGGIPFINPTSLDLGFLMRMALLIYVVGALTDFFDGYLAREWHAESLWGKILDQIADKIFVCGTIMGLIANEPQSEIVLPSALILFREFAVSALREGGAAKGMRLEVTWMAKWKTVFQIVALGIMLVADSWPHFGLDIEYLENVRTVGVISVWGAAVITLWSGAQYFLAAQKEL